MQDCFCGETRGARGRDPVPLIGNGTLQHIKSPCSQESQAHKFGKPCEQQQQCRARRHGGSNDIALAHVFLLQFIYFTLARSVTLTQDEDDGAPNERSD